MPMHSEDAPAPPTVQPVPPVADAKIVMTKVEAVVFVVVEVPRVVRATLNQSISRSTPSTYSTPGAYNTTPVNSNYNSKPSNYYPTYTTYKTIIVENANMRGGPGLSYTVLSTLPIGTRVKLLSTDGSWFRVTYGTILGYIHKTVCR